MRPSLVPAGYDFAFSVFDDPDAQTLREGRMVYDFLRDLGFRTTKGVWPVRGSGQPSDRGGTCDEPDYRDWVLSLCAQGFEAGYHNTTLHTSAREATAQGLDRFRSLFGHDPLVMAQHFNCEENVYWGDARLTGWRRAVYNLAHRGRYRGRFRGHLPGDPLFWGDLCRERVGYVRSFVFPGINTLRRCPWMPYHDPSKPHVRAWFASSEGSNVRRFVQTLSEAAQEELCEQRGTCIMYAHFGHGFVEGKSLHAGFRRVMTALASRRGWFVPVGTILRHLEASHGLHVLKPSERVTLERRWLLPKLLSGTS